MSLDPTQASQLPSHSSRTVTKSAQIYTIGGSAYTMPAVSGEIHVAGQTLYKGNHIDVAGVSVSYDAAGTAIVIGSDARPFAPSIVSKTIRDETMFGAGHVSIHDSSDQVGDSSTRDGMPTSQGMTHVGHGESTEQPFLSNRPPTFIFAGSTYTASTSGVFIIADITLIPGSAVTISGTRVFYDNIKGGIVIGSSTIPLQPESAPTAAMVGTFTFASWTFTADPKSAFVMDGQTLSPGAAITVSGTPISYLPATTDKSDGTCKGAIGVGSSTIAIQSVSLPSTSTMGALNFPTTGSRGLSAFASSTFTADPTFADGQTLEPGAAITISSSTIPKASDSIDVVIGTSTQPVGLGGYIMAGFGSGPAGPTSPAHSLEPTGMNSTSNGSTGYTGVAFSGEASRRWFDGKTVCCGIGVAALVFL
jgi:hypothetical protein